MQIVIEKYILRKLKWYKLLSVKQKIGGSSPLLRALKCISAYGSDRSPKPCIDRVQFFGGAPNTAPSSRLDETIVPELRLGCYGGEANLVEASG